MERESTTDARRLNSIDDPSNRLLNFDERVSLQENSIISPLLHALYRDAKE